MESKKEDMKVKHTPGPWTFEDIGLNEYGVTTFQIDQHEDAPCRGDENHAVHIAEVYNDVPNAKLIAAAPDLLEACMNVNVSVNKWLMRDFKDTALDVNPDFRESLKTVREAIKKATD